MKKTFIYLFTIMSILVLSHIDGNAAKPAKKSSSNSSETSYVNCNYANLNFEKTSDGYFSPVGHNYYAKENETSIELIFKNNNTCTSVYIDGGQKSTQTLRYTQSGNTIKISGMGNCTLMDNCRQLKSSDGLLFILTK